LPAFPQNPFVVKVSPVFQIAESGVSKVKLTVPEGTVGRQEGVIGVTCQTEDGGLKTKFAPPSFFLEMTDPIPPFNTMFSMSAVIPWKDGSIIRRRDKVSLIRSEGWLDPFTPCEEWKKENAKFQ
tara:strand:+ start:144 stop:518 length:375 start_codon:yes stop_codon:yes gene_type:complete